ncbi:helix-turn-helix domain-containing protein [Ferrovibrio terrae]|uniref:Helix-turn-helix domain-containing protein n=1 Tax=Ferrovibrio terrae TaxID=2594003 RepID=A0A516H2E1_9PROT|nr:IclR family transcriptional regulator [Ferrovibrio terrae]QDO97943.1 helix-turn-helix domain-containing protein [Ferrovibrio terrae]
MSTTTINARDFSTSLARGLRVITAFDRDNDEMTLSEVARRADMTRAAARRYLLTLCELGYVTGDGKYFRLTPRVLELGFAFLTSMHIWERAQPFMERLTEQVNESCSISVLEGSDIVYVARVPTKRIMSVALGIGTRLPAFCTSMGRVLLADLRPSELDQFFSDGSFKPLTPHTVVDPARLREKVGEARRDGYAMVDQELEIGLRSIAVPIRNQAGRVLAAMNVSGHASRITAEDMQQRYLSPLLYAAEGIRMALA